MTRINMPAFALALAGVALGGCAEISYTTVKTEDEVLHVRSKAAPATGDVRAQVRQDGAILAVNAAMKCDLIEEREIERTTIEEKENEALGAQIVIAALSAGMIVGGAAMLADADSVYPNDQSSRTYNEFGPDAERVPGVLLVGLGTIAIAVPLVDIVRSIGSREREEIIKEQSTILRKDVPCAAVFPAANRQVTGRFRDRSVSLGALDGRGELRVNLAQVVPADLLQSPTPPARMDVYVDQALVGSARLAPAIEAFEREMAEREDLAYRALDVPRCEQERSDAACAPLGTFVATFPRGRRTAEVQAAHERATRAPQAQVAADPEAEKKRAELAAAEEKRQALLAAAQERAQLAAEQAAAKAAAEACKRECKASCKNDAKCALQCAEEACP